MEDEMRTTNEFTPTLNSLNATDDPRSMGGEMLGMDCHGNQLWLFRAIDKVANRRETEDGQILWSADIEGWNYTSQDAVRPGRPLTLPGSIGVLAKAMGGLQSLCEALGGVAPSTVRHWANGETVPQAPARALLDRLIEENLSYDLLDSETAEVIREATPAEIRDIPALLRPGILIPLRSFWPRRTMWSGPFAFQKVKIWLGHEGLLPGVPGQPVFVIFSFRLLEGPASQEPIPF
jgi:hypothetical protein